jgi:hypothetical protein
MARHRVLVLLRRYPQLTETYIETELRALHAKYDVHIVTRSLPNLKSPEHHDFAHIPGPVDDVIDAASRFRPEVIHTHYLHSATEVAEVANAINTTFTIRAHSYDVLRPDLDRLKGLAPIINSPRCRGVLTFPFTRHRLLEAGFCTDKLLDCYPVLDFERFFCRTSNGQAVMNVGACLPKKNMEDFVDLAPLVPSRRFNLYAVGYDINALRTYIDQRGGHVSLIPPKPHSAMPVEYKKHQWLVYTCSNVEATVGWPVAIAEAQASGVGVCVQGIRPDLSDYVGAGGHVFGSIEEVASIVSRPVSQRERELGFEQAKLSDVRRHVELLEQLW